MEKKVNKLGIKEDNMNTGKKREYSPAQKAASKKYDEKFDYIRVRLPKGTSDRIRAMGISANAFVANATLELLDRIESESKR